MACLEEYRLNFSLYLTPWLGTELHEHIQQPYPSQRFLSAAETLGLQILLGYKYTETLIFSALMAARWVLA